VKQLRTILGIARSSFSYWRRTAEARAARQVTDTLSVYGLLSGAVLLNRSRY
jgi:hypothetical protein